jgi:hypothetical protein
MLSIVFMLLYTTGFVVRTSNFGLTDLSSFYHTSTVSDHGGKIKLDSHIHQMLGKETPQPSASLEPEISGTEVILGDQKVSVHLMI